MVQVRRWGGDSAETRSSLVRGQIEVREQTFVLGRNEGVADKGGRGREAIELCRLMPCLWILRYLSW
jgi:hypothetical protein